MTMKMAERIKRRMVPERPMVSISLRLPEDVIEAERLTGEQKTA
jgi:hypothetical protein